MDALGLRSPYSFHSRNSSASLPVVFVVFTLEIFIFLSFIPYSSFHSLLSLSLYLLLPLLLPVSAPPGFPLSLCFALSLSRSLSRSVLHSVKLSMSRCFSIPSLTAQYLLSL